MYRVYADDPQARINLGIRRRLAPLLKNNRRKIELMNGLLLSLPGTPIVYYGDEIGMETISTWAIAMARTPMQWNGDRNAGFSRANPQRLFLPAIIDSEYHYSVRNVEIEHNSPHSLLWWMRRIIQLRKQFQAFGRGAIEFLAPDNPKVLAYLRQHEGETVLVLANLSRFVQQTQLDLSRFRGQTPIEMFGQTPFPPIGELPYFFMMGPYSFYWFRLQWSEKEAVEQSPEHLPECEIQAPWDTVFQGRSRSSLQKALPSFLTRHRWYGGKARTIQDVQLIDSFLVPNSPKQEPMYLLLIQVQYTDGEPDVYQTPVVFADATRTANILGDHPHAGIATVHRTDTGDRRTLCDATWEREFWQPVMQLLTRRRGLQGERGGVTTFQTKVFKSLVDTETSQITPTIHGGQQSNTSIVFGDRVILKMFRRIKEGTNPDLEVGRFLTEYAQVEHVPRLAGAIEYQDGEIEPMTLAILHEFRPNEGDTWVFTLDELARYLERVESIGNSLPAARPSSSLKSLVDIAKAEVPDAAQEAIGGYLHSASLLGRRTAQMHRALASNDELPTFKPEPFTKLYQRSLYQSMRSQARRVFTLLRKQRDKLPENLTAHVDQAVDQESRILELYQDVLDVKIDAMRIRCHGDYHLGQVLYTGKDFVIIDFEGEPERSMSERRIKMSPLKDVAGMIRSFHYAAHAARLSHAPRSSTGSDRQALLVEWARIWYAWSSGAFLRAYLEEVDGAAFLPSDPAQLETLLNAYVLEKAVYELLYELNNRPDWVAIPLEAVLELAK
ncbi:MAG: putative maltokinase [Pirellulaceae bacterium]